MPSEESRNHLQMAKNHLELAEFAYNKKNYSDSISLLAQSVELSSKSFLSNFDVISSNEFIEVGHIPSKGFEKSIDKVDTGYALIKSNLSQIKLKDDEKIPEFDIKTIQFDKRKMKGMMSNISKNPQQFKSISKKNMQTFLLVIKNLQKQLEVSRERISSNEEYLQNANDFEKTVFGILDGQKMKKEQIQMFKYISFIYYGLLGDTLNIKDKAAVFHSVINVTVTLNFLSIITQPHAIPSRYKIYKESDLIVKNFPQMKTGLENALGDLDTIFIISKKNANFDET